MCEASFSEYRIKTKQYRLRFEFEGNFRSFKILKIIIFSIREKQYFCVLGTPRFVIRCFVFIACVFSL